MVVDIMAERSSAVVTPAPGASASDAGSQRSETTLSETSGSDDSERVGDISLITASRVFIPFAEAFEEVTKLHGYALVGSGE